MEITLPAALALFTLLTISSGSYFLSQKLKIPYTVLLVALGIILIPATRIFPFMQEFSLTPNLLFYIFLPILLFESAYNMDFRKIMENIRSIFSLAVVSLLISTFFISGAMYYAFNLLGFPLPFIVALLFASLISSTDPVAVLALFKEFGVPKRLSLIFEGESIFNDATAVALFLVILQIAQTGFRGMSSITEGALMFTTMLAAGLLFGVGMGWIFSQFIQFTRENEFVSITLTLVVSHLTFILSELISQHFVFFGQDIHLSPIIATTAAALVLGNYGRYKISIRAEEYVEKVWGQFAFIANSIVFILMGLILATIPISISALIWPIIVTVGIVAIGRVLSIYPVIGFLNWRKKETHIPRSWQHLLAWGSLRGALAIMVGLLIPDTLSIPGWTHSFTPKEFILTVTIGCIYTTIFLKATTIGLLINKLKINKLSEVEHIEQEESLAMISGKVLSRLSDFKAKGYIDENSYNEIKATYEKRLEHFASFSKDHHDNFTSHERVLRIYALGIEKHFLKELFTYEEITESVFKKVLKKLTLQLERLERGSIEFNPFTPDPAGFLERTTEFSKKVLPWNSLSSDELITESYLYYRALTIILRKVIKELELINESYTFCIFEPRALEHTIKLYKNLRDHTQSRMNTMSEEHTVLIQKVNTDLATRASYKVTESVLNDLYKKEMFTPKVYINLRDQLLK